MLYHMRVMYKKINPEKTELIPKKQDLSAIEHRQGRSITGTIACVFNVASLIGLHLRKH